VQWFCLAWGLNTLIYYIPEYTLKMGLGQWARKREIIKGFRAMGQEAGNNKRA
jgi:hypothetical protein